jgi:hypothetical protein
MRDVVDVGKGGGDENIPLALLGKNLFALAHSTALACICWIRFDVYVIAQIRRWCPIVVVS